MSKFPHWNESPTELLYGVEVEYLVTDINDDQSIMSRKSYEQFRDMLLTNGFTHRPGSNHYRVSRDLGSGFLAIQPDFSFNIVEISFPPYQCLDELEADFNATLKLVDKCLLQLGFCRSKYCYLNPSNTEAIEAISPEIQDHIAVLQMTSPHGLQFDPLFGAKNVSTHVHLNIESEEIYGQFPGMYFLEPLSAIFLREDFLSPDGREFQKYYNYRDTFGPGYLLKNIPEKLPKSKQDLTALNEKSTALFPGVSSNGVKDFSFIRPGKSGSIEFRSAPSYLNIARVKEVISFRVLQFMIGREIEPSAIQEFEIHKLFQHTIESKALDQKYARTVQRQLDISLNEIPSKYLNHLEKAFRILKSFS